MFGKNKVSQEEMEALKEKKAMDDRIFERLEEQQDEFTADVEEIDASYRQVDANVNQVMQNMKEAAALAEQNTRVEAELIHSMGIYREQVEAAEGWQASLCAEIKKLSGSAAKLVEENKHFTSPSKYLSEFSTLLKSQNRSYDELINEMADCGKQMGVLALNAAIEAGRMGEPGKQFVAAAEDIRSYAGNYDRAVLNLRERLAQSDQKVAELEEQVRRLVKLLKENNVSTAKLMKSCNALSKRAEREKPEGLSDGAAALKNQVTILKNADEEIIKSEERNRMQMEDLGEEFVAQQKNQKELYGLMDPLFRHAVERKA
ncbi:MAG: methyl-accepting chemotaxis protein [Blautia sp.]|nr:methyl-accepting chemotaxis protein [Blautia sp.]